MSDPTSSARPSGPEAVVADLLADLANASLELDPVVRARLAALEGRQVQITVELPAALGGQRHFALAVVAGRLRLFARPAEAPNVIVRGRPPDLVAWLLGAETTGSRLGIDGDGTVLAELTAVLREFRPDLGAPLERLLGAEVARTALGTAELALAGLRSALQGAGQGVREGAARAFVDRSQASRLLDELTDLQLRVDRLGARVAAQEQRRTQP